MAETRNGSFAAQIQAFAEKTKANMDELVRQVTLDIGASLIYRSPVGNPELWKINQFAAGLAKMANIHNNNLRNNPANLDKAGRLRRGLKINIAPAPQKLFGPFRSPSEANTDVAGRFKPGLQNHVIRKPKGYVGGHFRANWQFGTTPPTEELDAIDPKGDDTVDALKSAIADTGAGGVTYLVNNCKYAIPLEYGHSTQAPQGMVRLTLAEFDIFLKRAAERLK